MLLCSATDIPTSTKLPPELDPETLRNWSVSEELDLRIEVQSHRSGIIHPREDDTPCRCMIADEIRIGISVEVQVDDRTYNITRPVLVTYKKALELDCLPGNLQRLFRALLHEYGDDLIVITDSRMKEAVSLVYNPTAEKALMAVFVPEWQPSP